MEEYAGALCDRKWPLHCMAMAMHPPARLQWLASTNGPHPPITNFQHDDRFPTFTTSIHHSSQATSIIETTGKLQACWQRIQM